MFWFNQAGFGLGWVLDRVLNRVSAYIFTRLIRVGLTSPTGEFGFTLPSVLLLVMYASQWCSLGQVLPYENYPRLGRFIQIQ